MSIRRFRDIGALVRAAREARGLTQADLAEQLAFSRDYLRTLEVGRPTVHDTRLFRTLDALGIGLTATFDLEPGDSNAD
jgi:transcriptional regulator with XRE-family HTH domain